MIAGGMSPNTGVEIWNPNDGTVKLAFDLLPHETPSLAMFRAFMIPIKGKNTFLFIFQKCQFSFQQDAKYQLFAERAIVHP